jgi:hypothetical protein
MTALDASVHGRYEKPVASRVRLPGDVDATETEERRSDRVKAA